MAKNKDYWGKRLADRLYDKNTRAMRVAVRKAYREQASAIKSAITDLYADMLEKGEISTTNLYAYGRFTALLRELDRACDGFAAKQEKAVKDGLNKAYKDAFGKSVEEMTGKAVHWGLQNRYMMEEAVSANFKGANFSTRIWNNQKKMKSLLAKEVQNVVASGQNKDTAVKMMMQKTGVSFSNADRLIRTETVRVINDGQKSAYISQGRTHGTYLVAADDRLCDECERIARESESNPIPLEDMEAVHHPGCRCTILPLVKMKTMAEYIQQEYAPTMKRSLTLEENEAAKGFKMELNNRGNERIIKNILPGVEDAVIPESKIMNYALADSNKAAAFKSALGYDTSNGHKLIENIRENVGRFESVEKGKNAYGTLYEVRMQLTGENGKTADVKTGWILDAETGETRLTSAYVAKKKGE